MNDVPKRPLSTGPSELGFRIRRGMVRWLSPTLLADTAMRVFFASVFGSYSDKREVEAALPSHPLPTYADSDELWIDYVADLGDGFGPTFSVASLLAAEKLDVADGPGAPLATRRGRILVLGGDEVYPTASIESYTDRTLGPYRAALPYVSGSPPHLYAIPGNHDWYDGLTSFLRVFCARAWVGGWQTQQSRSYFALELPRRWWLWGIDVQLDAYIDEPQLAYFRAAAERLRPGDPVILCSALPSWVYANVDDPEAYAKLDYFERKIVRPTGARVVLSLTGDAHHYARYEAADGSSQKITVGGGGAYLSATHHLPSELLLPPPASRDVAKTAPPSRYVRRETFPGISASRRRRAGVVLLPFWNGSFWVLVGAVHLLYLWLMQSASRGTDVAFTVFLRTLGWTDLVRGLVRSPLAIVATAVLAWGLMGFTRTHVWWKRALGVPHLAAHLAGIAGSIALAARLMDGVGEPVAYLAGVMGIVAVAGGLLGSWVFAAYLALADLAGVNSNELFAAQRIRGYKSFLRIYIDADGTLTLYPIGLRKTCRRWRLRPEGGPGDPWFTTDAPLSPELIEAPLRIDPRGSTP